MSCLYNSMRAAGLGDVTAVRDEYVNFLKKEDPSLDQSVMGSANFLQMYVNFHPDVAFILVYRHPTTSLPTDWIMTGALKPVKVVKIVHSGSVDGGHFENQTCDEFDMQRVIAAFRFRQ